MSVQNQNTTRCFFLPLRRSLVLNLIVSLILQKMVGEWGACFFAICDKSGRHHFKALIFPEMTISHRGNLALLLEQLAFAGFC